MKTMTEESLQRKLARLESALDTERARLRKACDKIPWGAGMRRTKCTPSFRRENELIEKIKVVKLQLSQMYNPQIEMFAHFKTKSSFHKTKCII